MPIIFEEVTGEIAPEPGASQEAPAPPAATGTEPSAELLRRMLHLIRERERRVRAD